MIQEAQEKYMINLFYTNEIFLNFTIKFYKTDNNAYRSSNISLLRSNIKMFLRPTILIK